MISLRSAQIQATVSKRQQMNPVRMTMLPPFTVRRCPPLTVYFFVNRDELPKKMHVILLQLSKCNYQQTL